MYMFMYTSFGYSPVDPFLLNSLYIASSQLTNHFQIIYCLRRENSIASTCWKLNLFFVSILFGWISWLSFISKEDDFGLELWSFFSMSLLVIEQPIKFYCKNNNVRFYSVLFFNFITSSYYEEEKRRHCIILCQQPMEFKMFTSFYQRYKKLTFSEWFYYNSEILPRVGMLSFINLQMNVKHKKCINCILIFIL